jgi:acetyl esterase/lipase
MKYIAMTDANWRRLAITSMWVLASVLGTASASAADATPANTPKPVVDDDGTVHLPALTVPYSSLASGEAKRNVVSFVRVLEEHAAGQCGSFDDCLFKPSVKRLEASFPVKITPEFIGGVQTDVVIPAAGISKKNAGRVLVNLHGGGFIVGARFGGQAESIPIASLGGIKVITVDYRESPQYKFPAASEDVANVYRELLKQYRPENIGIYGCSAGGLLAGEVVAWFQTHQLPRPGAVGMFGSGASVPVQGDTNYLVTPLLGPAFGPQGLLAWPEDANGFVKIAPYFDVPGIDLKNPLVSPAFHPSVLAAFPPSLLITGTRDQALSVVVYTHAQLIKAGAQADLHIWEGAQHCAYASSMVDGGVPETRDAWNVIVKFFDKHLGSQILLGSMTKDHHHPLKGSSQ